MLSTRRDASPSRRQRPGYSSRAWRVPADRVEVDAMAIQCVVRHILLPFQCSLRIALPDYREPPGPNGTRIKYPKSPSTSSILAKPVLTGASLHEAAQMSRFRLLGLVLSPWGVARIGGRGRTTVGALGLGESRNARYPTLGPSPGKKPTDDLRLSVGYIIILSV